MLLKITNIKERAKFFGKSGLIISIVGGTCGVLSSIFLKGLALVTSLRLANLWLIIFLPVSGAIFAYLYQRVGRGASQGNNIVIARANGDSSSVPWQMIPLTLFGTWATHLFGGSVGREGTAVQMGGAVSELVAKLFHLDRQAQASVLVCGISGGFSAVFGTPLAGAVFAIEVLALSQLRLNAFLPSLLTALLANWVASGLGTKHTVYQIGEIPPVSFSLVWWVILFGLLFGLVSRLFSRAIVWLKRYYAKRVPNIVWRSACGGGVVLLLVLVWQTTRYLGLSLPLLTDAFSGKQLPFDFINKLIFTVFSLGAGFQGGEVTPLFEIGATLGSTLAQLVGLPVAFVAALGFVGVFAGAANTPLACFVMGIELFGGAGAGWFLLVCLISYQASGSEGIYSAQASTLGKRQWLMLFKKG